MILDEEEDDWRNRFLSANEFFALVVDRYKENVIAGVIRNAVEIIRIIVRDIADEGKNIQ